MGKPLVRSPELQQLAVETYARLGSVNRVAKAIGHGSNITYRMLKDAGVDVPDRSTARANRARFKADDLHAVVADYQSGMAMKDLQRKYNCGQVAIHTAVRNAGILRRPRGQQPREMTDLERAEMARLYIEEKWPQGAIAVKLGCHQTVVSTHLRRIGVSKGSRPSMSNHGSWKGGVVKSADGYVFEIVPPEHKFSAMRNSSGYVAQHRLRVAEFLGRSLTRYESVHHKDGDRANNTLDNLQLRSGKHGKGVVLRCRCCGSIDIESKELE